MALGACVIEKHFTLCREDGGVDSGFSLEPDEFQAMVEAVRMAQRALGEVRYGCTAEEEKSKAFRRSLFAVENIKTGETFTLKNVRSIRPSCGLPPKCLGAIVGRTATCDIRKGTPLTAGQILDFQTQVDLYGAGHK